MAQLGFSIRIFLILIPIARRIAHTAMHHDPDWRIIDLTTGDQATTTTRAVRRLDRHADRQILLAHLDAFFAQFDSFDEPV